VKLVDTNILLYAVNPAAAEHKQVFPWWEKLCNGDEAIGLAWVTLLGFVRISTNPRVFPQPLTVRQALDQVAAWLALPQARTVQESQDHWKIVSQLIASVGVGGNLTTDAHLAALAISQNATLASCDADFLRFRAVRFENPLAQS
jgi:toxin-antitoxin system PIN domain toxin